ncbi:hypothetical protein KPL70_008593 [Citrus sinensis]|nr:hypothetical protein KPL70_008593 [Citrus sinensis]
MASSSSSSSCCCRLRDQWKYEHDVFVTFSGEDIRENFGSHLFAALFREKIKSFRDEQLRRGDEIMPALMQAIEESKISLVIFSKRYAFSRGCLEELVKIIECKKLYQTVIPVFYQVPPRDVRKQLGSFGDAFLQHEKNHKLLPRLEIWRDALKQASDLAGWDSNETRPESKLTDGIVNDVAEKLKSKAELMVKELVVLFNMAREKLDFHTTSLWNNKDFKQLHCRLNEVLSCLRNAERYRSYRYWLLCPLFADLRSLTHDVDELMDNFKNSDITLTKFRREVKKLDQRLLRFLDSVDKLVASHYRQRNADFEQPRPRTISPTYPCIEEINDETCVADITDGDIAANNLSSCNSTSRFNFKKAVFKLEIHDDIAQQAAFSIVSKFKGIYLTMHDFNTIPSPFM